MTTGDMKKLFLFLFIELGVGMAKDVNVVVFAFQVLLVLFLSFFDWVMHPIYSLVKWMILLLSFFSLNLFTFIRQSVDHLLKFD